MTCCNAALSDMSELSESKEVEERKIVLDGTSQIKIPAYFEASLINLLILASPVFTMEELTGAPCSLKDGVLVQSNGSKWSPKLVAKFRIGFFEES